MADTFAGLFTGGKPTPGNLPPALSTSLPVAAPKAGKFDGIFSTTATPKASSLPVTAAGYSPSNEKDPASGLPFAMVPVTIPKTFMSPETTVSLLDKTRVAPQVDPTKAQKIAPGVLQNPRMKESVSHQLRQTLGATAFQELDHVMPLSLGGSNATENLKPETAADPGKPYAPGKNPTPTDPLEAELFNKVHNGQMPLIDAWRAIGKAKGITIKEDSMKNNPAQNYLLNNPGTLKALADLQIDPLSLKADPRKAFSDALDTVDQAAVNAGTDLRGAFDAYTKPSSASQKVGSTAKAVASTAGWLLSPISAFFSAANQVPVLGTVSKLLTLPFTAVGEGAPHVSNAVIDKLPISQQAKDNLKPGIGEIFALATQIALGKATEVIVKGLKGKYSPEDVKTIVTKATELAKEKIGASPPPPAAPGSSLLPPVKEAAPALPLAEQAPVIEPKTALPIQKGGTVDLSAPPGKPVSDILPPAKPPVAPGEAVEAPKTLADILPPKSMLPPVEELKAPLAEPPAITEGAQPKPGSRGSIRPVEGTGAPKSRGLSQGIEAKAIENRIASNFGDLPEYRQVNMAEQAAKALDILETDPEGARAIAMGEKAAPKGVIPEHVLIAVENRAIKMGDGQTLRDLANTRLATEATTMGQRIRSLAERDPESPTAQIKAIQDAREKALQARIGKDKTVEGAKGEIVKQIKDRISSSRPKKIAWADFVQSITC